ncbi:MAG: SAP domain-containing protein [Candidatus Daviesbacteria bacterium]|nr:SAP domain-containing protein [Candidatus Daviesbacteria bacterium]
MSDTENKTLEEMSMPELWAEAKKLGVPKDGKKDELIARLKEAQEGGENMPKDKPKTEKSAKSEKPQQEVYISKYLELRLVNRSSYTKEVNGRIITVPGSSIQFHEGVYRTSDPDEIEFLDNHANNGNAFTKINRKDQGKASNELIAAQYKDLEQREKELAAREAAVTKKEMAAKGQAEDSDKPKAVSGIRSTADQPKF